jgi:hypothetical protein
MGEVISYLTNMEQEAVKRPVAQLKEAPIELEGILSVSLAFAQHLVPQQRHIRRRERLALEDELLGTFSMP